MLVSRCVEGAKVKEEKSSRPDFVAATSTHATGSRQ